MRTPPRSGWLLPMHCRWQGNNIHRALRKAASAFSVCVANGSFQSFPATALNLGFNRWMNPRPLADASSSPMLPCRHSSICKESRPCFRSNCLPRDCDEARDSFCCTLWILLLRHMAEVVEYLQLTAGYVLVEMLTIFQRNQTIKRSPQYQCWHP